MTLTSRSYFLRLVLISVGFSTTLLLTPMLADASSGGGGNAMPGVLEGKIPACGGYSQVLVAGTGLPGLLWVEPEVPCPGPPANIQVISAVQTTTCGSSEMLTLDVTDSDGYNVKDGTSVSLTTSLGQVPGAVSTRNGIATASFMARSEDSGRAEIVITSGYVQTTKVIEVTCS